MMISRLLRDLETSDLDIPHVQTDPLVALLIVQPHPLTTTFLKKYHTARERRIWDILPPEKVNT